jgi:hypothetical protein
MISDMRRALAESAMWSAVGAGSERHDSAELATSFVRYRGASDGSAEIRTARAGSSLAAGAIRDQVISWCGEHDVTHTLRAHRRRGAYTAVLRQRLATAADAGATVALARGLAATSAPILARSGFTRYATWDKYTIPVAQAGGQDLD